jgi:DNA-binding MarR family transcriptional regulator
MIPLEQTASILNNLDEKAEALYKYQSVMNCYSLIGHDYGTGVIMSEVEAHTLNYIEAEEGLTAKRLSEISDRTKSAISQIIAKLEKQGLIQRKVNPQNKREHWIYLTDLGKKTCDAHRSYDREGILSQINYLLKHCTPEEIDGFFKVLRYRINWFKRVNQTLPRKKIISSNNGKAVKIARYTGC